MYKRQVHAIFEEIEWVDENTISMLAARFPQSTSMEQVTGSLENPAVRNALSQPTSSAAVWREKNFEILLNGEWLSGTFDRVTIEKDASGNATRATILDFKTDRVFTDLEIETAVAKYRPQLDTYREVLQRMVTLPAAAIQCGLIFTREKTLRWL